MVTVLSDQGEVEVAGESAGAALWVAADGLEQASGWSLKPEGLCRAEVCVPVPAGAAEEFLRGDRVNLAGFWRHMGKPVVASDDGDVWVLGETSAERAAAMQTLQAPDFTLPDLQGRPHSLSDHRGRKVLLATWSS